MLFERFEDAGLSQFSYAVGCAGAGEIAIVDPRRDVDVYEEFASDQDVEITHVLETHIHADFASGARELAERTGAKLYASAYDAGEKYEVAFPHEKLEDADALEIGSVRIEALHTPGHTPEHLSFLIYDTHRSADVPEIMLSGDFLFVGSLGRPDLLGEDAKRELAGRLYASVRDKLSGLHAGLEVRPGHGAGSMCGAGMSARPISTLGFERIANPYLDPGLSETQFVEKILGSAPPFPPYYRRMKTLNSAGPPILDGLPGRDAIGLEEFHALSEAGHVVIDLRDHLAFGGGHIPNSFGIGVDGSLSTWAAWVVPYETPILLVAENAFAVDPAIRALVRVGLDQIRGWLEGGMNAWRQQGLPIATLPQVSIPELARARNEGSMDVLDVRADSEWKEGHIEGAVHVHGGMVEERLDEIPRNGRPLAVICGSGYRSTVAASVLKRAGFPDVRNVPGGMRGWKSARLPVVGRA